MKKLDSTVKELKGYVSDLDKYLNSKINKLDDDKKKKARELVKKTKKAINASIDKVADAIETIGDKDKLNELLDMIKAKSKEAVDYTIDKIEDLINNKSEPTIDDIQKDIMDEFNKIKDSETFKKTKVLVKEGYAKINEFLEKPEVQAKIKEAKKTTIRVAEKGVEGLKKVLDVDDTKKKSSKKTTSKKTVKKTSPKKTTKKSTKKTTKKVA